MQLTITHSVNNSSQRDRVAKSYWSALRYIIAEKYFHMFSKRFPAGCECDRLQGGHREHHLAYIYLQLLLVDGMLRCAAMGSHHLSAALIDATLRSYIYRWMIRRNIAARRLWKNSYSLCKKRRLWNTCSHLTMFCRILSLYCPTQ